MRASMYSKSNRRGSQANNEAPPRLIQTLAGPVHYKDSGWTSAEWALIESALARCVRPRPPDERRPAKPKRPKQKPRIPTAERRRLAQSEQLRLNLAPAPNPQRGSATNG
jgi:hypothetical protein